LLPSKGALTASPASYKDSRSNLPGDSIFGMRAPRQDPRATPRLQASWGSERLLRTLEAVTTPGRCSRSTTAGPMANGALQCGPTPSTRYQDIIKPNTPLLAGRRAPVRAGLDCHGLPIRAEGAAELGSEEPPPHHPDRPAPNQKAHAYALEQVERPEGPVSSVGGSGPTGTTPTLTACRGATRSAQNRVFGADGAGRATCYAGLKPVH